MNDQKSPSINAFPLPWEAGLYGNLSGIIGGYNFETQGYRGVTYTSCEYKGQPMFLNYTSPNIGINLYHLVLIGEEGYGEVDFMMKTDFGNYSLSPRFTSCEVYLTTSWTFFSTDCAILKQTNLTYTADSWATTNVIPMVVSNRPATLQYQARIRAQQ